MNTGVLLLPILAWVVGAAISLTALYFVIYFAIRNALREHTLNAIWAVSVKSSVPLEVKQPDAPSPS